MFPGKQGWGVGGWDLAGSLQVYANYMQIIEDSPGQLRLLGIPGGGGHKSPGQGVHRQELYTHQPPGGPVGGVNE